MCVCVCVCVCVYGTKVFWNSKVAQSAGAVEYTDCFSAEG